MGTSEFGQDIFSQVLRRSHFAACRTGGHLSRHRRQRSHRPARGICGGRLDTALMRRDRCVPCLPAPVAATSPITAALGTGLFNAVIALAVSWFPWYAHCARRRDGDKKRAVHFGCQAWASATGESCSAASVDHADHRAGLDGFWLCDLLPPTSLSFIGIGAQPPTPSGASWQRFRARASSTTGGR